MANDVSEIDSPKELRDSRENLLIWIMLASLGLSAGGVIWAIVTGEAHIGQRGGALGVALSFLMLFAGRDTSKRLLNLDLPGPDALWQTKTAEALEDTRDDEAAQFQQLRSELARAQSEIDGARASISAMLDWGAKEKIFLSISSVTSTLVWGFGDCAAKAFGAV